jgi:hypothetical protein
MIDQMWKDDPYLNRTKKDTSGFGEGRYVVVRIGDVAGVGGSFNVALRNQGPTQEKRFFVTERSIYTVFSMDGAFLRKHKGKPNTLLEGYKSQANSAKYGFQKLVEHAAWNDVGGTLGQVATTINTTNTAMVVPFRATKALFGINLQGKKLTFSTDAGNGTSPAGELNDGSNPYRVTVVAEDPQSNSVTVTGDNGGTTLATAVVGITNTAYVFVDGFYAQSLSGKRAWNPIAAPTTSDSFFGLDRTVSPHKLSGWRVTSKGNMMATLTYALSQGDMADLEQPFAFVHGDDWWNFMQEQDAKVQAGDSNKQGVAKKMFEVYSPAGTCLFVRANRTPQGYAWVGDPAEDVLRSEGDFPQILNEDKAGVMLRAGDADAYQSRLGGDANFMPDDSGKKLGPGAWTVVTW